MVASDDVLRKVESGMDKNGVRKLNCLKKEETGTKLAATPSFICGTVLSTLEFRDKFRNKFRDLYNLKFLNIPSHCDGCTSTF